jgi:hypothetical protein
MVYIEKSLTTLAQASLLPPAVNAGILWIGYAFYKNNHLGTDTTESTSTHTFTREEFREGGITSLLLTIANILLIILSSIIMFRTKEVLPIKKKVFWDDLRVARKICQNKAFLTPLVVDDPGMLMAPTDVEAPPVSSSG